MKEYIQNKIEISILRKCNSEEPIDEDLFEKMVADEFKKFIDWLWEFYKKETK